MGLFSSKKRTTVYSTAVNLVDSPPDDPNISAVAGAVVGNRDLTNGILTSQLNGLTVKARAALTYAQNHYTHGLPNGYTEVGAGDDAKVKAVIEASEGQTVQILQNILDNMDLEFMARPFLAKYRGWIEATNEVTAPPPGTVNKVFYDSASYVNSTTLQIKYVYDNGGLQYLTENIPVPYMDEDSIYYHVTYQPLDGLGNPEGPEKHWFYRETAGTYPTLDLAGGLAFTSPFYPIVPLRWDNVDLTHSSKANTDLYKTSKQLLDIMGLDFVGMGENINENPNVADIDHAFLYFGVDLLSGTPVVMSYLHDFFTHLEGTSVHNKADFDAWTSSQGHPPTNRVRIEDGGLKLEIVYNYIESAVIGGSVGPVGTVTREETILPVGKHQYWQDHEEWPRWVTAFDWERSSITFRKQTTAGSYVETKVVGLVHINYVKGNYRVETTLADAQDEENNNFVVPINQFLTDQMTLQEENELMYYSMNLIFNSVVVTRTKWYQSSFFKFVVLVVAVYLTITSGGAAGGIGKTLATAMGAKGVSATIIAVLINVAASMAISYGFRILVKELGMENSWVAWAAAVITLVYLGQQEGGLDGTPWAEALVHSVVAIPAGISANVQAEMKDLMEESKQFWEEAEEKTESLEAGQELLETSNLIDPFEFIEAGQYFNPDESPEEFYNRTIHAGNVGIIGLDAIHNFVDYKLTLPQTKSTLSTNLLGEA